MRHSTQSIRRCSRPLYSYNQQHPATTNHHDHPTMARQQQDTRNTTTHHTHPLGRLRQAIICGCSKTQQYAKTIHAPASSSPASTYPPA